MVNLGEIQNLLDLLYSDALSTKNPVLSDSAEFLAREINTRGKFLLDYQQELNNRGLKLNEVQDMRTHTSELFSVLMKFCILHNWSIEKMFTELHTELVTEYHKKETANSDNG